MYSERIAKVEQQQHCSSNAAQSQNNLSCGKCAFTWIENRGLPPDRLVCPRCKSNVVKRGLVQSSTATGTGTYDRKTIREIMEILEFTEGKVIYSGEGV